MRIEKKRIECWAIGKETMGHIKLDKLAIPETVKITLLGEPIIPASFDYYGHPNFTKEQQALYMFKEEAIKRQNNGKYTPLKAEIVYEERIFDVPRNTFDTIKGIEKSLQSLSELNEMLQNREKFHMTHEEDLNEFLLFGCFHLSECGGIMSIEKDEKDKVKTNGDVEEYSTFVQHNDELFTWVSNSGYAIPTTDSVCPCCGKAFTIDDVKNNPCVSIQGKFYHDSCWRNYRKLTEVDKLTRQMMDLIYKSTDYHFELLPNGYCNRDCCSHIPWLLFHTIDGDIIMGWRKRVISIEWQANYKPFDMDELFASENVTKWVESDGRRGIHAWGNDKAYEYLQKVLKFLNPDYSNY